MGNIFWAKSSAPVKDDTSRGVKRKTVPDSETLTTTRKLSESDYPTTFKEYCSKRGVKRKASGHGEEEPAKKKAKRGSPDLNLFGKESAEDSGKESCNTSAEDVRAGKKKTANDGKEPKTKKKRRLHLEKTKQAMDALRAEFEAKYEQQDQLGEGGCATVFAGYRKADNLPVAIKRNPKERILCKHVDRTGKQVSMEVAIMLKLANKTSGSVGMSAPVSLLDWYDLDQELILVLERPIPAKDLLNYICLYEIGEQHAKIILKQLVDALIDLEEKKIFHRDIKLENILIETSSDVTRVRLIDFGVSCFVKRGACYQTFYGTTNFIPPEWFSHYRYRAGPTTVWQMGVVLFETLHCGPRFKTSAFLENRMRISKTLSKNCQDFLRSCLITDPKKRPTLEQLGIHPWLNTTDPDTH